MSASRDLNPRLRSKM